MKIAFDESRKHFDQRIEGNIRLRLIGVDKPSPAQIEKRPAQEDVGKPELGDQVDEIAKFADDEIVEKVVTDK